MTLTCPGEAIQTPSWRATIVPMFRILLVSLAVVSLACSAMAQAPRNGTLAGRPGTNLAVLRSNASLTGPRFQRSLSTWPLKTSIKPAALHARYTGTMAKLECYSVVVPNKPGKRRARAQRLQGSRREFRRHLGLPGGQGQVQDRSGGGRHGMSQEGRQNVYSSVPAGGSTGPPAVTVASPSAFSTR